MDSPSFFMVYLEGGTNPTYRHATILGAETEAKRLTKLTGKKSYVLCSLMSVELNEFKVKDMRPNNELPF